LPNPYNYSFNEDTSTYNFATKNNIEYKVAFVVDETFSAVSGIVIHNVYQMIIEKVTDTLEKFDSSVAATIKSIVEAFFSNSENAMIYICDDSDQKAKTRFNIFERWYWSSSMTDCITKIDNIISCYSNGEIHKLYTSLLFHIDNNNKETILEIYHTIEQILNEDKQ